MALQDTLAEIKKLTKLTAEEPAAEPQSTLSGRRGRHNRAIEQLKTLREDYTRGLLESSVFIVVTGSGAKEFKELTKKDYFTADPEAIFNDLVEDIPTTFFGRESPASLMGIVSRRLEDKAQELGVIEYPQLQFKAKYNREVKTRADFVTILKAAMNEQVGAELIGLQSVISIRDIAIDRNHKSKVTPIILTTEDVQLASDAFEGISRLTRGRVVLVGAGDYSNLKEEVTVGIAEVNDESVKSVMKRVKSVLK